MGAKSPDESGCQVLHERSKNDDLKICLSFINSKGACKWVEYWWINPLLTCYLQSEQVHLCCMNLNISRWLPIKLLHTIHSFIVDNIHVICVGKCAWMFFYAVQFERRTVGCLHKEIFGRPPANRKCSGPAERTRQVEILSVVGPFYCPGRFSGPEIVVKYCWPYLSFS